MGVTQSDLRAKEVRSATLEECVGRTAGFVDAGRAREAFLCVQSYARAAWAAGAPDAAERERRAALVHGDDAPVVFMRLAPCVSPAVATALGPALDDLRLDVCTALDAALRRRAAPATLLYLCATAAALGVADDTPTAPCCALAPVCFTRYLDAAIAANVQRALVDAASAASASSTDSTDASTSTTDPTGTVEVLKQHFDFVEGVLATAQRLVPPGTAYAALLAPVLTALVGRAQAETRALLQGLAARPALVELAVAVDEDGDALDAPRTERELGAACAAVMQCRLHARCATRVLTAYTDAQDAAQHAWEALLTLVGEERNIESLAPASAQEPEPEHLGNNEEDDIPTASLDEFLGQQAAPDAMQGPLEHPVPPVELFPDSYVTLALTGAFDRAAEDVGAVVVKPPTSEPKEQQQEQKEEQKTKAAQDDTKEEQEEDTQKQLEACNREIDVLLKTLVNMYMGLEDRYTARCVTQLLAAHTAVPAGGGAVPLVDEAFFVLTNALERAASTMDTSCFAAIATTVNDKIGGALADRLRLWLRQWEEGATARRIDSFIAINNALGSVAKNTTTLKEHALARVRDLFADASQLRDVVACIDDFQRTANVCTLFFLLLFLALSLFTFGLPQKLHTLLQENITRLSKTVVSVLQPQIEVFRRTDYCLTEVCNTAQHINSKRPHIPLPCPQSQFQQCEINDPYMLQLISTLETTLSSFLVC